MILFQRRTEVLPPVVSVAQFHDDHGIRVGRVAHLLIECRARATLQR